MATTFSFDEINRVITVGGSPLPTEVTIQQLINAIRDWEDNLENMDCAKVADASGKEDLGGNLQVGITLKLLNWKVKFADRPPPDWVGCGVSGGNLVAVNGNNQPMNPIQPSPYVTVTIKGAVSAALIADVAEWTQTEKDTIFSDVDKVKVEIDKIEHGGVGEYERDKESLEAIRARGDAAWTTSKPAKGFRL